MKASREQLIACLVLGLAAGCSGKKPPTTTERVANVAVLVLQPQPAEDRIALPGMVEAWADIRLSAEVEGRVESMAADEGDTVAAGQVLVEIDASVLKADEKQAEAALNALKAEEEKVKAGARPEELAIAEAKARGAEASVQQARASLAQAKATEANAQRDLVRTEVLAKKGAESPERLDAVRTAATVAGERRLAADEQLRAVNEQWMSARTELALLKEGARREDRQAIAARVAQAQAVLNLAAIRRKKATVKSPISGILGGRLCDVGEYLRVGAPVADVVNLDRVKVVVPVPEKDIIFVKTGATMRVVFDRLNNLERDGTVIYQSPKADPRALTYDVKLEIDNAGGVLRPGMIGRAVLVRRRLEQAIAVPFDAIIGRDMGYAAFVEDGGVAREKVVEVGFFDAEKVVVMSGLKAGDRLIVAGHRDLVDGDTVRIPPRAAVGSAASTQASGRVRS